MYIDDLLVFSNTLDEHLVHLRRVYERLRAHQFYAQPEKCSFGQRNVEFCGFIVGAHGVRTQPAKLAVLHAWPPPTDAD